MKRMTPQHAGVIAGSAALALSVSSCGLGTSAGLVSSTELGPKLSKVKSLDGAQIAVGSKQFTEQQILGKIAVILLKADGADVKDFTTIPGSTAARQAHLDGQIQFMWDYTGTAWVSYLGKTKPIQNSYQQWEAVRDADKANGITWLPAAPANNTYDLALRSDTAKKLGVTKLSDIKKVPKSKRTICVDSEFANRDDGLEPLLKTYGVPLGSEVPNNQIKKMDSGAIYSAIDSGVCTFGEIFTTDGRIKALNLSVPTDDKKFFPLYNIAPVFSTKTLEKYPQLKELFAPVAKKITNSTMIDLNAKVDVEGQDPADVAETWLKQQGFVK